MANSVSKINVVVGANTSQLTAGMNQASATVQKGMQRTQMAAQQATFAIDDFMTSFSTGGLSGGLRGAGNNLSMIAASLGGIKTQLAVIGVIAGAQLLISYFKGGKTEAQELNEQLEKMSEHFKTMRSLKSLRREIVAGQGEAAAFRNRAAPTRDEVRTERERLDAAIKAATADRDKLQFDSAQTRGEAEKQARRAIAAGGGEVDAEIGKRIKSQLAEAERLGLEAKMRQNQVEDLGRQKALLDDREKELQQFWFRREQSLGDAGFRGFQPFVNQQMREATANELMQVTDELNSMRAKFSLADMFRMLPGANAMGSSGAVGAINAAMAGPRNAQDAGPALMRQQLGELKRIRELEERKKGLLEVVGL